MTATTLLHDKPKALLLASDPLALRLLRAAFEGRGFDVRSAADGDSGLRMLLDVILDLDVLVTDLQLEGRDGWSLVRFVRGAGGEWELPIVVVGDVDPSVRAQLLALGADAVVDRMDGMNAPADAALALAQGRRTASAAGGPPSAAPPPLLLLDAVAFAGRGAGSSPAPAQYRVSVAAPISSYRSARAMRYCPA